MAMKTSTPWWVSALFGVGLLSLFTGQHVLAHLDGVAALCTWLGLILVLGATGLRAFAMARSTGKRRAVEMIMLASHAGALVALGLYWLGGPAGAKMLGISQAAAVAKWHTVATVLWTIVMTASLLPLLMAELSLGATGRTRLEPVAESDDAVELFRVKDMTANGLTIALAAAFLMVTCNVAEQRDVRKDVSYFKTSAPGSATVNMAKALNEPVTVYLFFPEVNEVGDEVAAYFHELARQSDGKLIVERHDRMVSPGLVKDLKVSTDGTIVLKKGDKNEKLTVSTDFNKARREELRELDSKVQKTLMQVLRAKRIAYFSVGHGELNDPASAGPMAMVDPLAKATLVKQLMGLLNYEVKDWSGLGKPVPDDCSVLFVLAPKTGLLDEELATIDSYLGRGGSLLLALAPGAPVELGPLTSRLGVHFEPTILADDKEFMVSRGNASDHSQIVTNQFASHASVTTLNRSGVRYGILMLDSGSLTDAVFTEGSKARRTYVIRSMTSSWIDSTNNFEFDKDSEKRDRYNIVAAIEDPDAKADKPVEGQPQDGMRAMVFATGKVFTDAMLGSRRLGLNQALIVDSVKWLGGEEKFAGETVSEKDVAIEHTKSQDVVWYYASIVGAPFVILGLGLMSVMWRRRRAQRRRS